MCFLSKLVALPLTAQVVTFKELHELTVQTNINGLKSNLQMVVVLSWGIRYTGVGSEENQIMVK